MKPLHGIVVASVILVMSFAQSEGSHTPTGHSATWDNPVPYPGGYRNWIHVKTALGSDGFHHIYANAKAMEGYKNGKFPDDAVIVADFLEMIEQEDGNIIEGKRRFIDVMIKNDQLYDSTGGWGWEEFNGDSKTERNVGNNAKKQCFECHTTQRDHDFVFSKLRK